MKDGLTSSRLVPILSVISASLPKD